jgi:16S rRNA (cytosine1402-N4)-methyltransferase
MWRECIQALLDGSKPDQEGENATPLVFVDGTLGGGGHCQALLESLRPGDVVFGCDRDTDALETATQRLSKYTKAENDSSLPLFIPVQSNFAHLTRELLVQHYQKTCGDVDADQRIPNRFANLEDDGVDGILLDLGLSSYQIDTAKRGFAFMQDGPLDMRMGKNFDGTLTAADICNEFDFIEIQKLLRIYGDEPRAKRIAISIIDHRPLRTTVDLQNAVAAVIPEYSKTRRMGRTATLARVFQSLRIAVNQEDVMLERALTKMAPSLLRPGGRLVVLSYQSMEDRFTKRAMRDGTISLTEAHESNVNQRDIFGRYIGAPKPFRPLGKPIKASEDEVESNVRARSATLRVAEKQRSLQSTENPSSS